MIVHVCSDYKAISPDAVRRHAVARQTWAIQGWHEMLIAETDVPRLFHEPICKLPYIRDLFDIACVKQPDSTIVVFTNHDICVRSDAALRIVVALQSNDAAYSFRRDHGRFDAPLPDEQAAGGNEYAGCDLFAFRVGWWRCWRHDYPDLLLAREAWDCCLRVLMESTNANKPVSVPDISYHERHANGWESPYVRYTLPGQKHNLRLAYTWLATRGLKPESFAIRYPR